MKKIFVYIFLVLLIAACGPTPTVSPLAVPTNSIRSTPTSISPTAAPMQSVDTATAVIQPTQTNASSSNDVAPLTLQILSPQDEAVVDTPQVDVTGSASAGAVVSVNDAILIVGADGRFSTTIDLDEGPNLIEVIASNDNGDEMSVILTVTYEP